MRILIENYRGWDIFFDTIEENFYSKSDEYDTQSSKKSFASAKKYVDDFIKENATFKPLFVHQIHDRKIVEITGIRKDGRFISKELGQISAYSDGHYFLVDQKNDPIFYEIDILKTEIEKLKDKRIDLENTIIKKTLTDIKKEL